jgi:hypothetical protein
LPGDAIHGGLEATGGVAFHTDRVSTYTAGGFAALCSGVEDPPVDRPGRLVPTTTRPPSRSSRPQWEVLSRHQLKMRDEGEASSRLGRAVLYHQPRHGSAAMKSPLDYDNSASVITTPHNRSSTIQGQAPSTSTPGSAGDGHAVRHRSRHGSGRRTGADRGRAGARHRRERVPRRERNITRSTPPDSSTWTANGCSMWSRAVAAPALPAGSRSRTSHGGTASTYSRWTRSAATTTGCGTASRTGRTDAWMPGDRRRPLRCHRPGAHRRRRRSAPRAATNHRSPPPLA